MAFENENMSVVKLTVSAYQKKAPTERSKNHLIYAYVGFPCFGRILKFDREERGPWNMGFKFGSDIPKGRHYPEFV